MVHLVLSRKYRPGRFGDLVGQEHVEQTLTHAITSGRIGHAYLFIGPRGTGKTTTARIFAKALNCEQGPTPQPCGTCPSCVGIAAGNDLDVVEMDAASNNGVDDVRALRDSVGYRPSRSRYRIWIVDEVHMLSLAAFNAFLKTLEEPPPQAKFLFCTTEAHKLPETFVSRVQRLEFRRIDEARIAARLESLVAREGLTAEAGVCERIASGVLGGLRDAESLLEQLLACAQDGRVTLLDLDAVSGRAAGRDVLAMLDAVLSGDAAAALERAQACVLSGAKPDVVLDQTIEALRAALRAAARAGAAAKGAPATDDPDVARRAAAFGLPRIARSLDLLLEKRRHLKDGADGRLILEIAAVELARLPSARDLDALLAALAREGPPRAAALGGPGPSVAVGSRAAAAPPTGASVAEESAPRVDARGPVRPVELEALARAWPDLVADIERRSRRVGSAFARARLVAVGADTMTIALPAGDVVARGTLKERETVELCRAATRELLGCALRPAVAEESDAVAAPGTGAAPPSLAERPTPPMPRAGGPASGPVAVSRAASEAAPSPEAPRRDATLDDVRAHPTVRAVLDAFGARVLAVHATEPEATPPRAERRAEGGGGAGTSGRGA